jgi:hypothetical protein
MERTSYYSAFRSYDKIPKKTIIKEERFILAYGVRDFSPWSLGFIVSGTVVKQNSSPHGAQDEK